MVGFVYSVFLSSVSVQKALWKERSDFGGPRLRQVRKLGKSKYDHTMGGNQGEWVKGEGFWSPSWAEESPGSPYPVHPVTSDGETQAQSWVRGWASFIAR